MINFSEIIQPVEGTINSFLGNTNSDVHDIQEYCAKAVQALPSKLVDISSFFAYYGRTNIIGTLDNAGEYWVEEDPTIRWDAHEVCNALCDSDHVMSENILFDYIPKYGDEIHRDIISNEYSQYDTSKYVMGIKRFTCLMSTASLLDVANMVTSISSFDDLKSILREYTNGQCINSIFNEIFSISYSSPQSALLVLKQLFEKWILGNGTAAENEFDLLNNYEYSDYVSVSAFSYGFYALTGINLTEGLKQGLIYFYSWNYNLTKTSLQWVFSKLTEVGKALFSSEIFEVSDSFRSSALPEYPATVSKYSIEQIISYFSSDVGLLISNHKNNIITLLQNARYISRTVQIGNALLDIELDPDAGYLTIKTYVILSLDHNLANISNEVGMYAPSCYIGSNGRAGLGIYANNGHLEIANPVSSIVAINNSRLSEIGTDTDKQLLATSIAGYIDGLYMVCSRGFAASSVTANYHLLFNDDLSFSVSTQSEAWIAYTQFPKSNCYSVSHGDTIFNSGAIAMSNDQEGAINRILNNRSEATNADYALAVYGGAFSTPAVRNITQYDDFFVFACLSTIFGYNGTDTTFFGQNYAWVDDSWIISSNTCYNNVLYSTYNILTANEVQSIYRNRWLSVGAVAITMVAAYFGFRTGAFKKGFSTLFKKSLTRAGVGGGISGDIEQQIDSSSSNIDKIIRLIK